MYAVNRVVPLLAVAALLAGCAKEAPPGRPESPPAPPQAQAKPDPKRLLCNEHQCYEDECFFCHEELREKGRLWCQEHNRYEDRCFRCHPEQQEKNRAFCEKHFLYEDECFLCNPALKKQARAETTRLLCKEHGVPEDECGICHPDLAAKLAPGQGLKVRMASPQAAAKAGIRTAAPQVAPISAGVECYAEIVFNQNRLAQITLPVAAIVRSVEVDLGSRVEAGALLGKVAAAAYQRVVTEVWLRRRAVERERKLHAERISAAKDVQEAEAAYEAALAALQQFPTVDTPTPDHAEGLAQGALLAVRAPFAGEIVERTAVQGALVEAGKPLFALADRATMWAMLNIPETQLARVRVGQKVELTVEALPGQTFTGTLTWIAAQLDEHTRLAKARAEMPNPDGRLRARMFAGARILTGTSEKAVLVPPSALQQVEGHPFVFVKLQDDLFEARPVQLGSRENDTLEILGGVRPEDQVVVSGAFVVKSQFLISRLGAGCCPE